jgi:hypothetical protein
MNAIYKFFASLSASVLLGACAAPQVTGSRDGLGPAIGANQGVMIAKLQNILAQRPLVGSAKWTVLT